METSTEPEAMLEQMKARLGLLEQDRDRLRNEVDRLGARLASLGAQLTLERAVQRDQLARLSVRVQELRIVVTGDWSPL